MKAKLLVVTSTFPRWKSDTDPPFVYELSKRLASDFDIIVHTPYCHVTNHGTINEGSISKKVNECREFTALFHWNKFGGKLRRIFHNVEK